MAMEIGQQDEDEDCVPVLFSEQILHQYMQLRKWLQTMLN